MSDIKESGSKIASVREITLHPDWKYDQENYDADIAIVALSDSVEFSKEIQPICLPGASFDAVIGKGTIVGWGKTTAKAAYDDTPNQLEVPVVNASYCYTRFPELARISSHRAFCAGVEKIKLGSCTGIAGGGGFFMKDFKQQFWSLRGIFGNEKYNCDDISFGTFTNVARFKNWISIEMQRTANIDWEVVEIYCKKYW